MAQRSGAMMDVGWMPGFGVEALDAAEFILERFGRVAE